MKKLRINAFVIAVIVTSLVGCNKPAEIKIDPEMVILEGTQATLQLKASVLNKDGETIPDAKVLWFCKDNKIVKLNANSGEISSVASGETTVEASVVGTDPLITQTVDIRVKIPGSINVSHERLRLWIGQVKENVNAEVLSEKKAFIEGYLPTWSSDDPSIVKVEQIVDPKRRRSWVKMEGLKEGITYIHADFQGLSKRIRVAVADENQEYAADGTPIPMKKDNKEDKKKQEGQ